MSQPYIVKNMALETAYLVPACLPPSITVMAAWRRGLFRYVNERFAFDDR